MFFANTFRVLGFSQNRKTLFRIRSINVYRFEASNRSPKSIPRRTMKKIYKMIPMFPEKKAFGIQ